MFTKFFTYFTALLFSSLFITAQHTVLHNVIPLGEHFKETINFEINKSDFPVNTGFKPLIKSDLPNDIFIDSILYNYDKKYKFFRKHKNSWFWRKLLFEDFISVEKDNFSLYVNPLFFLELGKTADTSNFFINTRGIEIKGSIGNKLSYYSSFRENQAKFRPYIYDWSWNHLVVPGQGALKKNNTDLSKFDFSGSEAYLSFTPVNWFNLQIGQAKNFIGEGHRSLLISDNSFSYPFAKFSFTYKGLKYVSLFSQFRDFEGAYYNYHFRKHGAFNYLSYNYKNRLEIGLFEGVIYRTNDTANYINKFKYDYFIPIIGVKTGTTRFDTTDNLIVGANAKVKLTDHIQIYGQFALDDPYQKKYAFQAGIKTFDIFGSRYNNQQLYFQSEYNLATTRTYSHRDIKHQTWTHYNQEFAHPAGSDFGELIIKLKYSVYDFMVHLNYNSIIYNRNNTNSNILITDDENYLSYLEPVTVNHYTIIGSYIINPRTDLQIFIGFDRREIYSENNKIENYYMIGLKTAVSNFYYDF